MHGSEISIPSTSSHRPALKTDYEQKKLIIKQNVGFTQFSITNYLKSVLILLIKVILANLQILAD